jgi:hypothetical protein
MLAVFVKRDDLHGNVASERVLLDLTQHIPSQHIWEEDVERNRGRLVLLGKLDGILAARCGHDLEAFFMRKIDHDPHVVGIIFHDQEQGLAGREIVPVVGHRLERALGLGRQQPHRWRRGHIGSCAA